MEIKSYLSEKEKFSDLLLVYIDGESENEEEDDEYNLFEKINQEKEDKFTLKEFLHLLLSISNDYHRQPHFFDRIEKIITLIQDSIKQNFSNSELFELFIKNKRILLILFELKIITINDPSIEIYFKNMISNYQLILNKETEKNDYFSTQSLHKAPRTRQSGFSKNLNNKYEFEIKSFLCYFYPEIESLIEPQMKEILLKEMTQFSEHSQFLKNRKIGENDSTICSLIRDDLIDEFIPYITRKNFSTSSLITPSIFETNRFLIKNFNQTSLIEYAAFYGSIQIFNYLRLNDAALNPFLWLYAIHGKNAEIIHLIEENEVEPPQENYNFCFVEAIKCHHDDHFLISFF